MIRILAPLEVKTVISSWPAAVLPRRENRASVSEWRASNWTSAYLSA